MWLISRNEVEAGTMDTNLTCMRAYSRRDLMLIQGSTSSLWVPRSFWDADAPKEAAKHRLHIQAGTNGASTPSPSAAQACVPPKTLYNQNLKAECIPQCYICAHVLPCCSRLCASQCQLHKAEPVCTSYTQAIKCTFDFAGMAMGQMQCTASLPSHSTGRA